MTRFFTAGTNMVGGTAILAGNDAEHIRVLRMKPGERLIICDGKGTDYMCRFVAYDGKTAQVSVDEMKLSESEPNIKVKIYAGLPKGERTDYIIQKCTELGAHEILFFESERCIAKPKLNSMDGKLQRWQKIAESAAAQSGRGIIPKVSYLFNYVDMLDSAIKSDLRLFLYETGDDRLSLRSALSASNYESAAIITGPEGGFSEAEAAMARGVGFTVCSLGQRILRCETAPVAVLSALMYESGNLE